MWKKIGISLAVSILLLGINSAYGVTPQKVKITNVRDTQFTISWVTELPKIGMVNYGTSTVPGKIAYDDRGSQTSAYTHHVTITGLMPHSTYYYQIVSGTLTGNIGSITTGASLLPVGSDVVYGQVYRQDGKTPAKEAICYLRLKDADGMNSRGSSELVSVLVDKNGYWFTELVNFRTDDLKKLFRYSEFGDELCIEIEGGYDGSTTCVINTSNDSPAPDIVLSKE